MNFFALKFVRLTCGKSRHFFFADIPREKQRELFVFF